ncbi:MAG: cation-translocating P-type ATPase [Ilumatobacteraceae bacterium]
MTVPRSATVGLTAAEARRRFAADGPNELATTRRHGLITQVLQVAREPMLLLLLAAGTINFALADPFDGTILMVAVLFVVAISVVQSRRTENALSALRDLSSPRALVVRDGEPVRVPGREVVVGDRVLIAEGDRVPADAVLVEAVNLEVDEAALSGESLPVPKVAAGPEDLPAMGPPGGDDTPWVHSGTLVVGGRGVGIVLATGAGTGLGRIGTALSDIEEGRTPLQREIDRIVRVVAVIGVAAAAAVIGVVGATRADWGEALLAGIATSISMLPEEFPVVLTVFLALGARRMSRRRVLARRPPVIEALGSVSVLCVDKTGTITMNAMAVADIVTAKGDHQPIDDRSPATTAAATVLATAVAACPDEPVDPMDRAIVATGVDPCAGRPVREYPLRPELLAVGQCRDLAEGGRVVAVKGAPEAVLDLAGLEGQSRDEVMRRVESLTATGRRVLGVAVAPLGDGADPPDALADPEPRFVGLVGLRDPVRPGVVEAVAECARAGVRTVMITGDHPGTAIAVGREVGLVVDGDGDGTDDVITGAELAAMSDEELADRVRSVNVYARMVPEQKLRLVRALQAAGEVVGMTGDGVNDAPALRAADIGIAMGRRGTDVAREAASLVITDDDYTSIVGGIRRGRGIFDNLRKAMSYIIAVHVAIFGMALFPLLAVDWPLVLLPVQLALLELVIDPACSIVFESEEIDPRIMEQPPRRLGQPIFDRGTLSVAVAQGVGVLVAVIAVYLWAVAGDRPAAEVRTLAFTTLVLANIGLILVNRSWRLSVLGTFAERHNPTLKWILGITLGFLMLLVELPPLRTAFDLGPIPVVEWVVPVVAAGAGLAWFEVRKLLRAAR